MAASSKRARHLGAHLILIDESGLLLAPLLRRTLAPKGQTPFLLHKAKHREKVSLIAALSISPKSQRLGLYFSSIINGSFDNEDVAWFLRALLRHLRGPVIVLWDRGPMHRGPAIRQVQADHPRLQLEQLPAYAPDFNPVEQVWSDLKWSKLCNFAPKDSQHMEARAFQELQAVRHDKKRLRKFWAGSKLPWPRALLT